MTVSLSQGGLGLGAMWGQETATEMLAAAGLDDVQVHRIEEDPVNCCYVAGDQIRRPSRERRPTCRQHLTPSGFEPGSLVISLGHSRQFGDNRLGGQTPYQPAK